MKEKFTSVAALFVFAILGAIIPSSPMAQTLAFPGAEGFGRLAQGGRGGRVIEVTNLNDAGPGSLREACEASGPRIVVFRVSGVISLTTPAWGPNIEVKNPYLTVAGQTAPGDGIMLKGLLWITTDHVIVRHMRSRVGWATQNGWNFGMAGHHIIFDHCSGSWSTDEGIMIHGGSDVTIQWCIVAEGIYDPSTEYRSSNGICLYTDVENVTLHHNYLAMNYFHNPMIDVKSTGSAQQIVEVVNNVVYYMDQLGGGAHQQTIEGPSHCNFVGNAYIQHKDAVWTGYGPMYVVSTTGFAGFSGLYLKDNICQERPDDTFPEKNFVRQDNGPFPVTTTRFPAPVLTSETDAFGAYEDVLNNAGATVPVRDTVDRRLVSYARSVVFKPGQVGKGVLGKIISHENEVGGFPGYGPGVPPADSDHDGMPDLWETSNGLNPNSAVDGPQDKDSDGYTNVEEYLNELAGNNANTAISFVKPGAVSKSMAFRRAKQNPLDIFGRSINENTTNSKKKTLTREIMNRKLGQAK